MFSLVCVTPVHGGPWRQTMNPLTPWPWVIVLTHWPETTWPYPAGNNLELSVSLKRWLVCLAMLMRDLSCGYRMFKILGNGLVAKWKRMHWPKLQGCQKRNNADPMSLEDVQGVFFMFTAFLFIACLELVAENLLHNYCRHNKMTLWRYGSLKTLTKWNSFLGPTVCTSYL